MKKTDGSWTETLYDHGMNEGTNISKLSVALAHREDVNEERGEFDFLMFFFCLFLGELSGLEI